MNSLFRRAPDTTDQAAQLTRIEQQLTAQLAALSDTAAALEKHVARFSKEQFKANTLAEGAVADAHAAVNVARTALERLSTEERPSQVRPPDGTGRLLEALMPILDGLEAGLASGETQVQSLADATARETLRGWLEGQRLLRERLLALFAKEGIRPIPTLDRAFDPYRHVAVETVDDPTRPPGTIQAERRRGYETDQRVLRFADVIVTRTPAGF